MSDRDNLPERTAEQTDEAHEPRDFQQGPLLKVGVVFIVLLVMAGAIAVIEQIVFSGLAPDLSARPPALSGAPVAATPPAPALQPAPAQDLQQFRAHEDQILGSYGWTDKKRGVVRIPIDRAIDLVLQRGLPVQAGAGSYQDEGTQLPGGSSAGRMLENVHP